MVIWTIILIFVGMMFLIKEIKKFDRLTVMVKAIHIISVGYSLLVTANAEQMPNICRATGLSLKIGVNNISLNLDIA